MKLIDLDFKDNIKDNTCFDALKKIKLPSKNIEEFKHFDLNELYEFEYNFNYSSYSSIEQFEYLKNDAFYYIFLSNSQFLPQHSYISEHILFSKNQKSQHKSSNALYYLSEAFIEQENQITIKKSLDKPLLIINLFKNDNSFIPTSLTFNIENDCKVDLVEFFVSQNIGNCFVNINRSFTLKENAILNYTKQEKFSSLDTSIFNFTSTLEKKSTLNIVSLDYNAKKSLNVWDFNLDEENVSLCINGIIHINEKQQSGNIANILHDKKNISSEINIQHILDDDAKAVFDVKSTISENANYAKVFQSSQTTLLSDNAKINAQPRLQIYTDELEAKHSATTGAINQEQLYYLKSRGISHKKAISMIIESYENKVLDKIENHLIQDFIKKILTQSKEAKDV